MINEKNVNLKNECREIEGYNPYDRAIWLDEDTEAPKPYLCVNERITWYHKYCDFYKLPSGVTTEVIPELTKAGMITMRACVRVGETFFTGYGSRLVDRSEGYSGDDIEAAETRALGRALRNAGFCSPFDEGETTPVDGFKPQTIPFVGVPMSSEQIIAEIVNNEEAPDKKVAKTKKQAENAVPETTKDATAPNATSSVGIEMQLANALKTAYPFKPWPKRPTYELLDLPDLQKNLTWIAESYTGNPDISKWATFILQHIYSNSETNKKIYLAAREILRNQGLIK